MRGSFSSTVILLLAALVSGAEESKSTVRFSNNDRLSGSLESLGTDSLVWKSPVLEKPTPFFLGSVLDLTLLAELPGIKAGHEASVTLTNGDVYLGQMVAVSDDVVELDTWYAGHLKFNRLMVADIKIAELPDLIYRGPAGLDGWTQSGSKTAWIYQSSGFRAVTPGSIGRNVKLPDECSISFDAAWRGSFGLELVFFADDLASDSLTSGYAIKFQQRYISLRSCKTKRNVGNTTNAGALQENEKARIEIRASLKSGKICLLIDGKIIDVWTDPDVARNEIGRGIRFINPTGGRLQISRIEVGAWDGEVGNFDRDEGLNNAQGGDDENEDGDAPPQAEKPRIGRMELRNGDSIDGQVVSIVDGMITVKTPFRDVKLPIEALRSISLKPADLERAKLENGDIRAWFPDNSSIVFRLDGVKDGMITGYSQNFGTAPFKMSAFSRIEFNIYDRKLEEMRTANKW